MTYVVTKIIKGNPYLYEVKSVREGDRVRQVFVRYLGRADKPDREYSETEPVERRERIRRPAVAAISEAVAPTVAVEAETPPAVEPKPLSIIPKVTKEYWQMPREEYRNLQVRRPDGTIVGTWEDHERVVRQALSEGKHIPPEVLKDYPELSPEPTPEVMITPIEPEITPINPYMNMPIERVRRDATHGVKLAKEALAVREAVTPEVTKPENIPIGHTENLVIPEKGWKEFNPKTGALIPLPDTEMVTVYRGMRIGSDEIASGKLQPNRWVTLTEDRAKAYALEEGTVVKATVLRKDLLTNGSDLYYKPTTTLPKAEAGMPKTEVKPEAKTVAEPLLIEPTISEPIVKELEIKEPTASVTPEVTKPLQTIAPNTPRAKFGTVSGLPDSFKITTPDGASLNGMVRNAGFEGKGISPTRGELFFAEVPATIQRQGIATSLNIDALRLMEKNGTTTVKVFPTTESGKASLAKLIREGYLSEPIATSEAGATEHTILLGRKPTIPKAEEVSEPKETKREGSLIAKYTETKMSPETGLDTEYSTEYRLIGAPENAGAEWMGNEYGIIRVYSKGGAEVDRDLLEVGMSEDAVVKALPFESSYKKAEKFGLAKTEYEKYEKDLADKEQAKEAEAQAEQAGYERYHQTIRDLGSIKGVKKTNITYFSPIDNEQKTREGFDVGNGVGIVVHEMGRGKEYAVTHINTGLAMGHNWKNRAEAVALAKSVAKITDWSQFSNEKEIPQEIMSQAAGLVRGFTQKSLQPTPIEVTQTEIPKPKEVVEPEVKPEPEYLYHASRRGDLHKTGIEPSIAGVIKKDPEGTKVFMASDPESAVGAILSEERLKTEQGVPGYPYKGKGEIVVYRVKLPEGDYYQDPRSGDYITKRAIKPEEIVGWKLRGQKFPEPVKSEAKLEPALSISEIPYSRDLDIRNIEALPKGTGAKYLIALKGQGDELIAKQWARVKPASLKPDEVLVSMTPPVAEKLESTTAKPAISKEVTPATEVATTETGLMEGVKPLGAGDIASGWQQTYRGRMIYKTDLALENTKESLVFNKITSSPSYPKLMAAYKRFQRSLYGADDPYMLDQVQEMERQPWELLTAHGGVMNAKSGTAKTLRSLSDAVFSESKLPRKPEGKFRGESGLDWDAIKVEPTAMPKISQHEAKIREENLTLKQNITKAVEERPSRISHGNTAKNAFYVTKDNRIIPADEFSQISRGDDIISVHSHSGENWEQYTREHGQESFQPPNAADFDHLRWLVKQGYGNKLAVIMGDGRYIQVEIPEPAQPRFTRMGRKTLEKLLYPESKGASDAEHLAKLKEAAKEEGWLLTEGDWKA